MAPLRHGKRADGQPQMIQALLNARASNLDGYLTEKRVVVMPTADSRQRREAPTAAAESIPASGTDAPLKETILDGLGFGSYSLPDRDQVITELVPVPDWPQNGINVALPEMNWSLDPDRVHALFAGEYRHPAPLWQSTKKHDGWYVTESGDVFDYQYGFSHGQICGGVLSYKYAVLLATKVGHIDARILATKRALIPAAAAAHGVTAVPSTELVTPEDTVTISAYVHDPARRRPAVAVLLDRQSGASDAEPPGNDASVTLANWLRTAVHPD
jgi:hypothetical protein